MSEIKLTKNELRQQQNKLAQLEKYLPTLQLKKAMLQSEVLEARQEIEQCQRVLEKAKQHVDALAPLLSESGAVDFDTAASIKQLNKHYENIAGVEVPYFDSIDFHDIHYSLVETSPWIDSIIAGLRSLATAHAKVLVAEEKKAALEKELREVSIRVNLFEKILIPRALQNIKKIKVFLGDMQLAAVSQAKVAKKKILSKRV